VASILRDARPTSLDALVANRSGPALPVLGHWIETPALARARREIERALCESSDPIVLSGLSGHGKTLLLRRLWLRPPSDVAPIFARSDDVAPGEIATSILAASRAFPIHDAEGALARLLRTQSRRGVRPVLVVDGLESTRPGTLARLLAIVSASAVDAEADATRQEFERREWSGRLRVLRLTNLLRTGLERQSQIDPALIRLTSSEDDLPEHLRSPIAPLPTSYEPRPLSFFQTLMPGSGAKFERAWQQGRAAYNEAIHSGAGTGSTSFMANRKRAFSSLRHGGAFPSRRISPAGSKPPPR
jgi:hypothetical protein